MYQSVTRVCADENFHFFAGAPTERRLYVTMRLRKEAFRSAQRNKVWTRCPRVGVLHLRRQARVWIVVESRGAHFTDFVRRRDGAEAYDGYTRVATRVPRRPKVKSGGVGIDARPCTLHLWAADGSRQSKADHHARARTEMRAVRRVLISGEMGVESRTQMQK